MPSVASPLELCQHILFNALCENAKHASSSAHNTAHSDRVTAVMRFPSLDALLTTVFNSGPRNPKKQGTGVVVVVVVLVVVVRVVVSGASSSVPEVVVSITVVVVSDSVSNRLHVSRFSSKPHG